MAKSTKKTEASVEAPKPAVRRSRTTKTAAAPATRRAASPRRKTVVAVADDRGLSAAAAAQASAAVIALEPTHDEIATRAYFIHLRNGAGDPVNNWMLAVAELRAERGLL
jgi:hypothetical protein